MKLAAVKNHFANWREWEMNPIVLKELRQAVRSWAVTGMLLLFLLVLFITAIVFLANEGDGETQNMQLGRSMFSSFMTILAGASLLFIPLYIGIRVAVERLESNTDMLYVSTLSPGRIIRGKLYCSAYMTALFFSACMPFMAFTNLLRGVDLPTVFFILFFLFLLVCAVSQVAIFLACLPLSRAFKILVALAGLFFSFWIIGGSVFFGIELLSEGVGSRLSDPEFLMGTITVLVLGLIAMGLFHVLSVALISPPSANRARLPRLYVSLVWLLGGVLCFYWLTEVKEAGVFLIWTYFTFAILMPSLIAVVSNNDTLSYRVRRDIPAGGLRRLLAFPFYNGAAGGLVWVGGLAFLTCLVTQQVLNLANAWYPHGWSNLYNDVNFRCNMALVCYALSYGLTALIIHRRLLKRRTPKFAGLLAILLPAIWAITPGIVLFFLNQLSWQAMDSLQLGNVFNIYSSSDPSRTTLHLYFAGGWLALMLVLNAPWFFRQWKAFRPPVAPPPVIETAK